MGGPPITFGKEFREKYFTLLDSISIPVNHGSLGMVPTPVYEKYIQAIADQYSYPDRSSFHQQSCQL